MGKKILFIATGPIEWGSSRMRAYWVAESMRERGCHVNVEIFNGLEQSPNDVLGHDVFVWQKTVNLDIVNKTPDTRHYWDVCDPAWWWQPNECRVIADKMTAVVGSSAALCQDFNQWYGKDVAACIPDRLKLSHFHTQRQHQDVTPVRFIWFGVSVNRIALYGALANLERLVANGYKIELTIFDDRPDIRLNFTNSFPVYHVLWQLDKEVDVIASHDVALLPPYPGWWGKVKSNNKKLTSWACGLPVVSGWHYPEMEAVMSFTHRIEWPVVLNALEAYHVKYSAIQWEELIHQ